METSSVFPNGASFGMLTYIKENAAVRMRKPRNITGFRPQTTVLGPKTPNNVPPMQMKDEN